MSWKTAGAALAVILGLGLIFFGQPTVQQRLERLEPAVLAKLDQRQVQIDPAELLDLIYNRNVRLKILDLRDEPEFNLFHITGSERVTPALLRDPEWVRTLPPQTVIVAVSNGESRAADAWKLLAAQKVLNIYLLEGGINHWLDVYGPARITSKPSGKDRARRYRFKAALGGRHPESGPDPEKVPRREYQTKVKGIGKKAKKRGGCG
jgi:rhodanese-related sulfurtransferase